MPPKSVARGSKYATKLRRSRRISNRIKSMVKGQSASSNTKLPDKKSTAKAQPVSSKGQPSLTKDCGKSPNSKMAEVISQLASLNAEPSTSKKKSTVKRRRVMDISNEHIYVSNEINEHDSDTELSDDDFFDAMQSILKEWSPDEHDSNTELKDKDFSNAIKIILKELSPNLLISNPAIAYLNTFLNDVFERLASTASDILIGRNDVCMTVEDIESAVLHVVDGDLAKFCICEGRRAVKKFNEE